MIVVFEPEAMLVHHHREVLATAIREIEGCLEVDPSLTVDDVLANLRNDRDAMSDRPTLESRTVGECAHCGRPLAHGPDNALRHLRPDALLSNRGCRAASYDWRKGAEGGWDGDLDGSLYAKRQRQQPSTAAAPSLS